MSERRGEPERTERGQFNPGETAQVQEQDLRDAGTTAPEGEEISLTRSFMLVQLKLVIWRLQ